MMFDRPEVLNLLRMSHDEIVTLRRRVSELEPKAHAYDTIAQMSRLTVQNTSQTYGEDVAWRLKEAVEKIVAEREKERAAVEENPHD